MTGEAPLRARPTLVEFSPYGRNTGTLDPGPAYNRLLIQIRGTGDSDGSFDALGPRTQSDVAEAVRWACRQQWSDGRLAINGFSASAITIYNSLHQQAALRQGDGAQVRHLRALPRPDLARAGSRTSSRRPG